MDKRFLGILAALVIIFVGIFAVTQNSSNNSSNGSGSTNKTQPTNHVEGQGSTGVKLVEYGDYQCPVCYSYYPSVKQVADKYHQQIFFQFRNLPLVQVHGNAFAGARAAEAADKQNKYWEMHDLLYENQDPTGKTGWVASTSPLTIFDQLAQQLGLNISRFNKDYSSSQVNDAINADIQVFNSTHQDIATPTFFLDGQPVKTLDLLDPSTGRPSVDQFSKIIEAEIAKKTASQH